MVKKFFMAAALAATFSSSADAATVAVNPGVWNAFDVDFSLAASGGFEWIGGAANPNDPSPLKFQINLTAPALLQVVDGGFGGDRFLVFDGSTLLGTTSAAQNTYPNSMGADFDAAWADPKWSHGDFLLAAGSHLISGSLAVSALNGDGALIGATVGAVRISAVPVPSAALLFLSGSGLIGAAVRRRRA
jgi:hypothetical protein